MARYSNLITGRSARLPSDYAPDGSRAAQGAPDASGAKLGAGTGELRLDLPWPPSINHYWRRAGKVIHVSTEGTRFSRRCGIAVRGQFGAAPIDRPVAVLIEAWGPRRGWGDVDNRCKPLLDALTKAELWTDDKLVRDLRIVDRGRCDGGRVVVWVRPFLGKVD
jgi:crossover junction endodeoxyribonuclease RusA